MLIWWKFVIDKKGVVYFLEMMTLSPKGTFVFSSLM